MNNPRWTPWIPSPRPWTRNIRRSQSPSVRIGLISVRISSILRRSGGWSIPPIRSRRSTVSFARSRNPNRCFLPMTVCSKCPILPWRTLRKNGQANGRTGVWSTLNCRPTSPTGCPISKKRSGCQGSRWTAAPPLTTAVFRYNAIKRSVSRPLENINFRTVLHSAFGVYTKFGIQPKTVILPL